MSDSVTDSTFDALAAEYVLGTLDASERAHTHVLLGIDDAFAARVRVWERRLGELHLMVEPVQPDWRVYERVKARIGGFEANPFYAALGTRTGEERPPAPPQDGVPLAEAAPAPPEGDVSLADEVTPAQDGAPAPQPEAATTAPEAEAPSVLPSADEAPEQSAALEPVAPPEAPPWEAPPPDVAAASEMAAVVPTPAPDQPAPHLAPEASPAAEMPKSVEPAIITPPPIVESPPAEAPPRSLFAAWSRDGARIGPKAIAAASPPAAERASPFEDGGPAPVVAPALEGAAEAERWRRAVRQWRALAMVMTLLALTLATLVAGLRNFPEQLPSQLRPQLPALASAPSSFPQRPRPAAPPESQFEE